jgi:hypothetical protein
MLIIDPVHVLKRDKKVNLAQVVHPVLKVLKDHKELRGKREWE